ncbi:MAG: FkbM family methyltransferase [bacterium]|nr:FkbM family methyltransferase [bacterium]
MLKIAIKKIIPEKFHSVLVHFFSSYAQKSYSQEGEDVVLARFFGNIQRGFYVDIGAHHPKRFSNTYYFYKKGWNGINIDAMPGSMKLFKKVRSRDINIEEAVSDKREMLTYYGFNEPALNGFADELALERDGKNGYKIIFKKDIETKTLSEILDKYLPDNQHIDFMTIDVEGLDYNVLKSNNWEKYKPDFIVVEILNSKLEDIFDSQIYKFMCEIGYRAIAKTANDVIFKYEYLKSII